jgi:phytoene dehydrogenase-like protein
MSTPTLHRTTAGLAPAGCQQLVVATIANYDHFAELKQRGRAAYKAEKQRVTDLILDQIERHYVPELRKHLDLVIAGSPTTNERFVLATRGNAYGAHLTPERLRLGNVNCRTPFKNLWLVGATATSPSFAGGTHWATLLYEYLTGDTGWRDKTCAINLSRQLCNTS